MQTFISPLGKMGRFLWSPTPWFEMDMDLHRILPRVDWLGSWWTSKETFCKCGNNGFMPKETCRKCGNNGFNPNMPNVANVATREF